MHGPAYALRQVARRASPCYSTLGAVCPQVRSFAKEGAMQASFEQAQQRTLQFGLRSAALEASFFPVHTSLATGAARFAGLHGRHGCARNSAEKREQGEPSNTHLKLLPLTACRSKLGDKPGCCNPAQAP